MKVGLYFQLDERWGSGHRDKLNQRRDDHSSRRFRLLAMAGEGLGRVRSKILDPFAQLRVMYAKIVRGLRYRHTTLPGQLHCLKLELSRELPVSP